jgi:hypothetical protein
MAISPKMPFWPTVSNQIAAPDLDLSTHDNKELVALFALPEDRVAFREKVGRELPPHKKTEIDLVV